MPVFTLLLMKRVLIADDLEEPRALYVTSLALAGFVVEGAADGGQGIDVVSDHRPDGIYRLTLPDPDPIAVLISVLAGQQDASTAVMAEVRRFVTLAR